MPQDELIGSELEPNLRLEAVIARGSFGVVFRARQLAVGRAVAVKVLHPGFALETEPGHLFRDEIRAIGRIDHRNVVRIFDADETRDGRLYFVMELLDGPTLQQLAERGPMPAARAIALVGQLLEGLAAVHAAGHIHADVKPSNVVVCSDVNEERAVLIDFGLSRVRRSDRPAEAVGGTRAYMAPEQLHNWEVDARSDVFSAALVLIKLVTGLHRREGELAPPLDGIADPALHHALNRALALDPADRPSALDLARAFCGGAPDERPRPGPPPPFRELAPLTERDRGRLQGREADTLRLARRIDLSRAVVLTAPSGTGKTSLLRAGLIPYLDAAGIAHAYFACQGPMGTAVTRTIGDRATDGDPFVVILDQVEVALGPGADGPALLDQLLAEGPNPRLAVVLGVREDYVARLLAASPALTDGVPQVRLGPLDREGARAALVEPLAEHGVAVEPALLDRMLDELQAAGRSLAIDKGWGDEPSIYPPHLQLAGAALFDALDVNERVVGITHYEKLGGFSAIVAGHLERTLGELSATEQAIARDVFLALIALAPMRAMRNESDLVAEIAPGYGHAALLGVLDRLEARRLIARTTGLDGTASWCLIHDTLLPRIEAWLTLNDLERRRTADAVRFHLRQSQLEAPAILSARQLHRLARFAGLLDELEHEWQQRAGVVWTPRSLVQRSRQVLRYRRAIVTTATLAILALAAVLLGRWLDERRLRQREERLRDLNLGRFDLAIEAFDLRADPDRAVVRVPVDAGELPALGWALFDPDVDDPDQAGRLIDAPRFHHGVARPQPGLRVELGIEARGGDAFLVVTGRGRTGDDCPPSVIPLRHLPGHERYATPRAIHVLVPTCQATRIDTVPIPDGPFIAAGLGDPPAHFAATDLPPERVLTLPAFAIDRTEVTNAAFAVFAEMVGVHDIESPVYPEALRFAQAPSYPRGDLDWFDARAYCRFLGKELPTSLEWQKALRGGIVLPDGPNPAPRRNTPWLPGPTPAWELARIASDHALPAAGAATGVVADERRPGPAGSSAGDRSPYGVLDLAGNLQEWTLDVEPDHDNAQLRSRPRMTRGGNWYDTSATSLVDYMAIANPRAPRTRHPYLGLRCALHDARAR